MKNTGGDVHTISGNFDTSKGDLRKGQVYVEKKYFPDFSKIPKLLEDLVVMINSKLKKDLSSHEVLKLAADLHYNLVNIHPFGDGNGRVSRSMMNYIQMYHGVPLIKIFTEDRSDYIEALNNTEEENDISIFRNFICSQQIKFYKAEIQKFKDRNSGFQLML